jgi:hypothetical protein
LDKGDRAWAFVGVGGISRTSANLNLEVSGANIDGVVLRIGDGVSITGRVRVEGEPAQALANAHVRIQIGGPTADFSRSGSARIAKDGSFRDDYNPPGLYGIQAAGLPDGFYVKSIRAGDAEVMYSGVDATSGTGPPLDIVISPKGGLVSGVAQSEKTGKAAEGAIVVMVPREKERQCISAFYLQTNSDQVGRFTFRSVPPGEYAVYAWEDIEPTAWMDPDVIKPLEEQGKRVTVAESTRISVQVSLIPGESGGK